MNEVLNLIDVEGVLTVFYFIYAKVLTLINDTVLYVSIAVWVLAIIVSIRLIISRKGDDDERDSY